MPPLARSRSRTTDAAAAGKSKGSSSSPNLNSSARSPSEATLSQSDSDHADNRKANGMTTTVTTQRTSRPMVETRDTPDAGPDENADAEDSRSSSLSDVDDTQDDQPMTSPDFPASKLDGDLDDDSEAETERLDQITPKARRGTLSDGKFSTGRTSSSLAKELQVDSDIEEEPSPLSRSREVAAEDGIDPLDALASIATGIPEQPQLKRKRSVSDGSELSDVMDMDEPVRKRSHSQHEADDDDEDDELDEIADEALEDGAPPEDEAETDADKVNAGEEEEDEVATEHVPTVRPAKGRKGKRKGKKTKEADVENGQPVEGTLVAPELEGDEPAEGEGEAEEEDTAAADEELTKKKAALDGMAGLERHFIAWRKSYLSAEAAELENEMKLLEGPIYQCRHPDFLARRAAIDGRRDEKIKHEETLRRYKVEQEGLKLVAGRQQIGSQYFQSVRQLRDKRLEECNRHFHAVQRDRRRWGADERNHLRMFNPDRRQQVKDQTKYNKEVSILAGVAKYHGMPAAPPLSQPKKDFAEDDFKGMGLNIEPVQQRVKSRQPALTGPPSHPNAPEDRTEAAAQFYEQTPWANPLHPSHQQNPEMTNFYNPVRTATGPYATPMANHRIPSGPNGSASTIEAHSNQNSSALGQHSHNALDQPTSHPSDDSPSHGLRRVNSDVHSAPPSHAKREASLPDASQASRGFGSHTDGSAAQPFPPNGLHTGDTPRDREAERPHGLLGQRPFAVGVNGGRVGV